MAHLNGENPGSAESLAILSNQITAKTDAGRKYIRAPAAALEAAGLAVVDGAAIAPELGPQGRVFGTRYGGNKPLRNSNDTLRVGWSYIRSSGEYVFRIGGAAVALIKDNPTLTSGRLRDGLDS